MLVDDEPTMGDKFESLNLLGGEKVISDDNKPPTAASVNVLLRQALHADDRSLLLDCLYNRDEQVPLSVFYFALWFLLNAYSLCMYVCFCIGDC